MESQRNAALYGEGLDEGVGNVLEVTSKYGLWGQDVIAKCFHDLISATLELEQSLPAHTFVVPAMDTQRN